MNLLRNAIGMAKSPAAAFAPPTGPATGAAGGMLGHMKVPGLSSPAPVPTGPARMGGFLGKIGMGVPGGGDAPPMPNAPAVPQIPYAQQMGDAQAAAGAGGLMPPGMAPPGMPQGDALLAAMGKTQVGAAGMPEKQSPPLEALMAALRGGGGGAGIGLPAGIGGPNAVDAYGAPMRGLGGGIKNVMSQQPPAPALGAGIGRMTGRFR